MAVSNMILDLDEAIDRYQFSKREITKHSLFCFDTSNYTFKESKSLKEECCIDFICCYSVCCDIINKFLNLAEFSKYKDEFEKESKKNKNRIIAFLWFFEHIDGCYSFENFECQEVTKVIKKWCISNGIHYKEPTVYSN